MSLEFNADKQRISSQKPILLGSDDLTIRSGVGSDEKEVIRVQLDPSTQLPRVGVNRTGKKVEKITVTAPGSGYTTTPSITLSAPDLPIEEGGIQATASTNPLFVAIVAIVVDDTGYGYTTAPTVTITGGNGVGAQAEAFLDEIAYEFDVNGAIRTSTSIISDTARILNLDIDNFVTADAKFRAPNFKIYQNASGTQWQPNVTLFENDFVYLQGNIYRATNTGQTGTTHPTHTDGDVLNGAVNLRHEGYREDSPLLPYYGQTGDGIFPRSVTPLLGDKSTKVATTEYVLNLATNDVGGRVYVSEQIGNDENDGRSAAAPVRSIKRACQIASQSVGVKESVIIAGGNYVEDNPISIPPDCSIIGDNLRLVIIRPSNPRKHMFKFGDKNYINGITFRDAIDSFGDSEFTWDFAVTFDDKQRVYYDPNAGGDFGRRFPIGHQIFGPPRIRVTFGSNTGTNAPAPLQVGTLVSGENTGARGEVLQVQYDSTTGGDAYVTGSIDVDVLSGSFNLGETFEYYKGTSYTPTNVTYDPVTGETVFTIANHGFNLSDKILISPESLVFTCALDNNASTHRYPRPAAGDGQPDFAYKRWLSISAVTTNTFTVNVGASQDTSVHTFVSADANALTYAEEATQASPTDPVVFNDLRSFVSLDILSIRAEGEVISTGTDTTTTLPIVQVEIDPTYYTDPEYGGVVVYTNILSGGESNTRLNIHNFKENEEITISGMPTSGPDLSVLNGKQRVFKVLYDADGRSRRFVIAKDIASPAGITQISNGTVSSASHYLTLSLLNSPNKFSEQPFVERRYQDAVNLIRQNTDFIADEVVKQINDEFAQKWLTAWNVSGTTFDVYTTPNEFAHTYVSGGTVTYGGTQYNITDFSYANGTGVGTITLASAIPGLTSGETVKVENILLSCTQGEKIYPGFNIPNGDSKCYRDVKHFINAIIMDLEYGGNYHTIEAAKRYVQGTQIGYINNEITETVRAYERARELIILAMRNWNTGSGLYAEDDFVPVYSSLPLYKDPTVTEDTVGGNAGATCANVASAIDTLGYLFTDIISNQATSRFQDGSYLIARNIDLIAEQALADTLEEYPSLALNNPDRTKCKRDVKYILAGLRRDLILGGNSGIVSAGNLYYTGGQLTGVPESELPATRYAFTKARDYAINAMRNWTNGNYLGTTPTNATYNSTSGEVTVTIPTPNAPITINDRIAFKEGALTFSCASNGGGNLASPSPTDRNNGKSLAISAVSVNGASTIITCNVGNAGSAAGVAHTFVSAAANSTILIYDVVEVTSTVDKFEDWNITIDAAATPAKAQISPTSATYDPANGNFVITSAGHSVTTADSITIKPESFVFTCTMDGNKTEHKYPQNGQTAFANQLNVIAADTNTFTVNVGASGPDVQFTPTNATYDPATGDLVLTIGTHTLDIDEGIVLADNSLTFTCDMDNNQSQKTYPRPGIDPYAGRSIPITAKTDTTITLNVGASGPNKYFTPTAATYNPITGDMTVTVGQHGLGVGRSVVLTDNSFSFTCALDGNSSTHTYPRPGTDPYAGQSIAITSVGSTQHTPTNAPYDASTGIVTFTVTGHGFSNGDYVKVADGSLTYTCELDGNSVQKTYPRAGYDYPSGRWLQISNVTPNTFDVNVGPSSYTGAHTFVSAAANAIERQDGTFTINVGTSSDTSTHTFVGAAQNAIKHEPQTTHTFITASTNAVKHLPQSVHTFVRTEVAEAVSVYGQGQSPACSDVATAITTSFQTLDDILAGGSVTQTYGTLYDPTPTRPTQAILYDADNKYITPRGVWDDLPYIEASPYIQNSSIISFKGGNGCEIDGNKCAKPNVPFPGIEEDGSVSNPAQGKSMVASAFTIVSFGGTGYKVVNDGYTQLVSVFVIFCQDGIFCDTGGYASVTNSATNFGTFALRAKGYRAEEYPFDVGNITGIGSATGTGFTQFTVSGLGREPLEHYILKIDGYESENSAVDYFIDSVNNVTSGPPFTATFTVNQAAVFRDKSTGNVVNTDLGTFSGATVRLHRPSIVNSSSHTWEFAGAGTDYNALPENGGTKIEANEQVSENYGRVYTSGTDELGDFKVGYFAKIENRTGAITFTGTVTISEVEFLKLKGGDVVVTGFSDDNTLGGATSSNGVLPTQKAVKDYITNNLGPYINKAYSTNPVPRALVELTDSGKISIDQIPALRPFSVFTVASDAERLKLEGALAGDIAIVEGDPNANPPVPAASYILDNDVDSLYLGITVNAALDFGAIGSIYTGSNSGGTIQTTEYREGVVYSISITDSGSGYTSAPTVSITSPTTGVTAAATCTIANGQVVTVTIIESNGYTGGYGYTSAPTITFSAPPGGGTQATANALIESRLYGDIVNNIKIVDTDTIDDVNSVTVNLNRVVNTSAFDDLNWVSLSSNQIAAGDITSGVIATARLAFDSDAANSFTFLRGDQTYAPAVQTIKGAEQRYFEATFLAAANSGNKLTFPVSARSNILVGHTVSSTNSGIDPNTTVSSITDRTGYIEIEINNPLTQAIPAGTFLQFDRPEPPIIIDTNNTKNEYIDDIVIISGGSGYTANLDLKNVGPIQGGTGTGLYANFTTDGNGTIDSVVVTSGGSGFQNDFAITIPPALGNPTTAGNLSAKVNTAIRGFGDIQMDILRVTENTTSADAYGTVGVAKFKKSQFNVGLIGNGSVELKTGSQSGLDADLLDGQQGAFYQNAFNITSGTLNKLRLSGSYDIDISGQSGNTLRLRSQTSNPTSDSTADTFSEGAVINFINNSANGLADGGTANAVMTIRGKGSDATADGGVRQLAFTDNNNVWLRGSGTGVTTWSNWYKVWTQLSDGPGTGMDSDKLDNKQGAWYQDARNINFYQISDTRINGYLSEKKFQNSITIKQVTNKTYYDIYISGQALTTTPFLNGQTVNLYDANAQGVGTIVILNVNPFTSPDGDTSLNWTQITGYLNTGTFNTAETIGTAGNRVTFQEFWINETGTYDVAKLESDGGTAYLRLGRKDGTASTPAVLFNSSTSAASYNAGIFASGGNAGTGSGSLNVQVGGANNFTINNQVIWNAGNITFASNNVANTAVLRDANGNFTAGTISGSLTGAASLNVLKSGDTMTGTLTLNPSVDNTINIAASNKYFTFAGGLQFRGNGSSWNARFSTTNTGNPEILGAYDTNFSTARFTVSANGQVRIIGAHQGGDPYAQLQIRGEGTGSNSYTGILLDNPAGLQSHIRFADNGTLRCQWRWQSGTTVDNKLKFYSWISGQEFFTLDAANSNVGIGTTSPNTAYRLQVNGAFAATSKSFRIEHTTKENYDLVYGSLEGPEHGVYVRGKASDVVELPEYWTALVDEDSITVQLTPIGDHHAWVEKIEDNKIFIGGGESFYFVQGTRKDIDPLEVEVELPVEEEEN